MLNFLTFYQLYNLCKSVDYNTTDQLSNRAENNLPITIVVRMNN